MSIVADRAIKVWTSLGPRMLPFADAASAELPLGQLVRLSLFQVAAGMTMVLMVGTLNRVMIVELGVSSWFVAVMVAVPLVLAPFRVVVGYRSDTHRSFLGWRRVPYMWFGAMLQFGGLAIMPFALLVLSGDSDAPMAAGAIGAGLSFLLAGSGMHIVQTAGVALASDLSNDDNRPRVVAFLHTMQLLGMVVSALTLGALLANFSAVRLIQVVQGTALASFALNVLSMWKQEPRRPAAPEVDAQQKTFLQSWNELRRSGPQARLLVAVGLGSAAFSMQDILLEPYGAEILGLSVGSTTVLTAMMAAGSLVGLGFAARQLTRGADPYRLAALGALTGVLAFAAVILAGAFASPLLFRVGSTLIGVGTGLFGVGMLTGAMIEASGHESGIALGAWGSVHATCTGVAIAMGGILRDGLSALSEQGALGAALSDHAMPYSVVYHIEIALMFAALIAVGPLVRRRRVPSREAIRFGLAEMPS